MERHLNGKIAITTGDITRLAVDVIVNAANSTLAGGGGVDGAIHRAAGPELARAAVPQAPCPPGEARITPGFALKARWVVHSVGPVWRGGGAGEAGLLASCYRASLDLAAGAGARSIAFPAISTGVYGYPKRAAADVAVAAIAGWLAGSPEAIDRILLVAFQPPDAEILRAALAAG